MTKKVMDIMLESGMHLVCIKDDSIEKKYRLKLTWYNMGWHSRQIAKYEDFKSVIMHVYNIVETIDKQGEIK